MVASKDWRSVTRDTAALEVDARVRVEQADTNAASRDRLRLLCLCASEPETAEIVDASVRVWHSDADSSWYAEAEL